MASAVIRLQEVNKTLQPSGQLDVRRGKTGLTPSSGPEAAPRAAGGQISSTRPAQAWRPTKLHLYPQRDGPAQPSRSWQEADAPLQHASLPTPEMSLRASQVAPVVKNSPAKTRDIKEMDLIPGSGRSSGEGNYNPLQYTCLGNPMERGAWRATVHGVTKSPTLLE